MTTFTLILFGVLFLAVIALLVAGLAMTVLSTWLDLKDLIEQRRRRR